MKYFDRSLKIAYIVFTNFSIIKFKNKYKLNGFIAMKKICFLYL